MSASIPDLVPAVEAAPRSRRGGARRGAGAPKGNLNALKHGRYSRLRDVLPLAPSRSAAIARRLLGQEQRVAERHAASLMRLARYAQHHRARAAAIETGAPLPHPLLDTVTGRDVESVLAYAKAVIKRQNEENQRRAGLLTGESESIRAGLALATKLELVVGTMATVLDSATHQTTTPAQLAASLSPAYAPRNEQRKQSTDGASAESDPFVPRGPLNLTTRAKKKTKQSNAGAPSA